MPIRKVKRRLKLGRIVIALVILVVGIMSITKVIGTFSLKKSINNINEYYLGSATRDVNLYLFDSETEIMSTSNVTPRGTIVKSANKTKLIGDTEYVEVDINSEKYYVLKNTLVDTIDNCVLEQEKYIRTSVTVYKDEESSKIESFIKKGNKIDIIDFDKIDEFGNVNMYKIKYNDIEGWVYEKYLVDTLAEAEANYNENGVYDTHKKRKFSYELYGGKASTLDYYPYEKIEFEDNPLLKEAKTMYLNAGSDTMKKIDQYLNIAVNNGVNSIVVDIKDGALAYPSEVAKEYSTTAYKTSINKLTTYENVIKKIKDAGIYVIGRIVVFNDVHYGKDHPEDCISSNVSQQLWPSAFSRGAWEYNVELAKEAVNLFGFNEIQFDYVRFPESSYEMSKSKKTDFKNKYDEEKAETIQNFLIYATDQLHKLNVYLSVDVFGECSGTYVTSYGQYWPAISNVVDVISSMPYTDHFGRETDTWTNAYKTVYNWAKGASKRQKEIPTPAVARTWITAYNTPYWNPTVIYGAQKIIDQAQALLDAGLTGGFITWNSASSLSKYEQIKSAFAKDY